MKAGRASQLGLLQLQEIKWCWIFVEVSKDGNLNEWILVKALFNEPI